jgi:hypothetical protein
MKTDDLIRALAADTSQARPLSAQALAGLVPALAFAVLMVWLTLGFRADLAQSLVTPVSAVRIVLTGALGLVALRLGLLLARPDGRGRARLWPLGLIGALALGLLAWAYMTTPDGARQMAVVGKTTSTCLTTIPLLSILPVAAILYALRQGATTVPALAGAVAGLAGGGLSAAVYALHCTENSPLFYVTWYGLAILMVSAVSALLGARLLRW